MINTSEILQTVRMITEEKLDIRTITMGISLYECCHPDRKILYSSVYDRITKQAEHLVKTGEDLEREFGITRSTASRVLTLMEHKGLIIRSGVTHDARLKKLTLTEKAQGYSDVMRRNAREVNARLLKGFTAEDTEQLCAYLDRLQENHSR